MHSPFGKFFGKVMVPLAVKLQESVQKLKKNSKHSDNSHSSAKFQKYNY